MRTDEVVYEIAGLDARLTAAVRCLTQAVLEHSPTTFATSFSIEDMVVLDLIAEHRLPVEIFTLDTGRLPEETHALIERTRRHYGLPIRIVHPDPGHLEAFTRGEGTNAFHRSVELRKQCCEIRKVEPLRHALAGYRCWVTGLRREQAVTRGNIERLHWDESFRLMKLNPLVDWSERDTWTYIRARRVPYSELYDRGYRSIGCAPCTRAVMSSEGARDGRWWWEAPEHKECGLHVGPTGALARSTPSEATLA